MTHRVLARALLLPLAVAAGVALAQSLPAPWQSRDIGAVTEAGTFIADGKRLVITTAGKDIWDAADAFSYVYQPLDGDGEIACYVDSLGNSNGWAKAGVMMRETLNPGGLHAFCCITPGNGANLQWRPAFNGASQTSTEKQEGAAPVWLKLVRRGQTFTGYTWRGSGDWVQVAECTVPMGRRAYVGVAVTSHNEAQATQAVVWHPQVSRQ